MTSTPVTASSPPGGRPRSREVPATSFTAWLQGQATPIKEIAQQLGMSRWAVYHLRNGYHRPSLDVAQRIEVLSGGAVPMSSWPPAQRRQPAPEAKRKRKSSKRPRRKT